MNTAALAELDFSFLEDGSTALDIVDQKINEASMTDDRDAFYVCDLGELLKKHLRWVENLPRVMPFYAVKCNDRQAVVMTLASLGTGFDCASKTEIELVQSLGVQPDRIIYANPCKQASQIRYASAKGVQMMTFDNEDELFKMARNHENPKLVLRIFTDDTKAQCRLSVKFGAQLKDCRGLLERAKELGLDVIGVSFHVGGGCTDPTTFVQGIADAHCVFQMGDELGFNMNLLDIGGGFPGSEYEGIKFEDITAVINPALDKYFPADSGIKIIGEPGRYYVTPSFTLAVNIIAKKVTGELDCDEKNEDLTRMYYVNDGVYGSFNCFHFHNVPCFPAPHKQPKPDEAMYTSSVWGPTCDGLDRIVEQCTLPDLEVGDWFILEDMGAYTVAGCSNFNGFQRPDIHYVMSRTAWEQVQQICSQSMPAPAEE